MKLKTINSILRLVGLVLVLEVPTEDDPTCPTRFWIERWSTLIAREKFQRQCREKG